MDTTHTNRPQMMQDEGFSNNVTGENGSSVLSAAHKAFSIPELLELMLLQDGARIVDLFNAAAVCRTWRDTFTKSRPLQQMAQLVADTSGGWYEDEYPYDLGILVNRNVYYEDVSQCYFQLFFGIDEHRPIKVSPNLRKCYATQPPCKSMVAIPRCCKEDSEKIWNGRGITIDDIVTTATRIYAEHEHCPEMTEKVLDIDGPRYPKFEGVVRLPKDNRKHLAELEKRARSKLQTDEEVREMNHAGWGSTWYEYRKAPRDAAASGKNLPRWPEFLQGTHSLP